MAKHSSVSITVERQFESIGDEYMNQEYLEVEFDMPRSGDKWLTVRRKGVDETIYLPTAFLHDLHLLMQLKCPAQVEY